jgi:hypothetical protein
MSVMRGQLGRVKMDFQQCLGCPVIETLYIRLQTTMSILPLPHQRCHHHLHYPMIWATTLMISAVLMTMSVNMETAAAMQVLPMMVITTMMQDIKKRHGMVHRRCATLSLTVSCPDARFILN